MLNLILRRFHGWDRVQVSILKRQKSQSKCISIPFLKAIEILESGGPNQRLLTLSSSSTFHWDEPSVFWLSDSFQFGMTGVFLSVPRYSWCTPLLNPSSCMLVNHGPSRQSSKEEYKQWKWGATARYYTSHTKTMSPKRKSVPRSSRQSDHTKSSWPS